MGRGTHASMAHLSDSMHSRLWTYVLAACCLTALVTIWTMQHPTRICREDKALLSDMSPSLWRMLQNSLPPDVGGTLGKWMLTWQPEIRLEFDSLVRAGVTMDDPRLLAHLRKVIIPPSTHEKVKFSYGARMTPQEAEIIDILEEKRDGFYVECGALDGERSSNTFVLETRFDWDGLLVEMDPYFFIQLMGRNRKAYALNACLSPNTKPSYRTFTESSTGKGKLTATGLTVPCYPVYSVLLALNITHVDFFSLDVEGAELAIIKTMPMDKVTVSTWAVETAHGHGGKAAYKSYMEKLGYSVHKDIFYEEPKISLYVDDTIFVKNKR